MSLIAHCKEKQPDDCLKGMKLKVVVTNNV